MRLAISPDLIETARDGNGVDRLLETFWPHAFRIARSIIHDHTLAEDAAQEACAVIYRQISQLRSAEAFRVWAYRIVAREALRVAKRNVNAPLAAETSYLSDLDTRVDVLMALTQLSPDLRAVIVLQYYAELSSGEIASVLGIPSPTVRFRLARARQALRTILGAGSQVRTFMEASR